MSDQALPALDQREQMVRVDRAIAEAEKFQAHQPKLITEAQRSPWIRWRAPAQVIAAVIGGLLGVAANITHLAGH